MSQRLLNTTRMIFALWLLLTLLALTIAPISGCNEVIRARYCNNSLSCQRCQLGPRCPLRGTRAPPQPEGTPLVRGFQGAEDAKRILLKTLDRKRIDDSFTTCVPKLQWDDELADVAQAWADQCALVEYVPTDASPSPGKPRRLFHDRRSLRLAPITERKYHKEAGIAQTVHWARTSALDMSASLMELLASSEIRTLDGTIDALFLRGNETSGAPNVIMAQSTHVGCGWIQFNLGERSDGRNESAASENFLVCNYGVGEAVSTTCSNDEESLGLEPPGKIQSDQDKLEKTAQPALTYYSAPSSVIEDIKLCLAAIRCRRSVGIADPANALRTVNNGPVSSRTSCDGQVQDCLAAPSGLNFLAPSTLKKQTRRTWPSPVEIEASKCKIDTILCSLSADLHCEERYSRCWSLLDQKHLTGRKGGASAQLLRSLAPHSAVGQSIGPSEASLRSDDKTPKIEKLLKISLIHEAEELPTCECIDLVLSDGTKGACKAKMQSRKFCFVRKSPCVAADREGRVELSSPFGPLNGLVHVSFAICSSL